MCTAPILSVVYRKSCLHSCLMQAAQLFLVAPHPSGTYLNAATAGQHIDKVRSHHECCSVDAVLPAALYLYNQPTQAHMLWRVSLSGLVQMY
jgi:hypothetical protein